MKARKIFNDGTRQKEHARRFDEVKSQVFKDGSRRQVLAQLRNHEGKQISDKILDIVSKVDILDVDLRDLKISIDTFWNKGFKKGTPHNSYCVYLRDVWRCAFHVAATAQSVFETIEAVMNKFSHKNKHIGKKTHTYWVAAYAERRDEFINMQIYKFNSKLRGYLYHVRLSNPEWVGYKDYSSGQSIERFILQKDILLSNLDRDPEVIEYVKTHSITVRGDKMQKGDQVYGLDLLAHYTKYRTLLKKLANWTIKELENPEFGKDTGLNSYALKAYYDLERASMAVTREWKRCKHCGTWSSK